MGSGGHNKKSDAQKIKEGTFRADRSEAVTNAAAGAKIITGLFLPKVPEPSIPLNDEGKKKYLEIANLLFEQNKLTVVTCGDCERMAVMHQQMHERLKTGKSVSMDLIKRMDAISIRLRIAENAPALANPNQRNKFEGSGFSNARHSPFRLRPYRAPDTGEL